MSGRRSVWLTVASLTALLVSVLVPLGAEAGASTTYQTSDLAASGHGKGTFKALSCTSAGNCVGVGVDVGSNQPLVAIETAGTWVSSTYVRSTATVPQGALNAVSCVSAANCTAVGQDNSGRPFFVTGNPATWTNTTIGTVVNADTTVNLGSFATVSCVSPNWCAVAGNDSSNDAIILVGDPTTWTSATAGFIVNSDSTSSHGYFYGISCPSAADCTAVGNDAANNPTVLTGNPATWTNSTTGTLVHADTGNSQGYFAAVSCATTINCTAVGRDSSGKPILLTGGPTLWSTSTFGVALSASSTSAGGNFTSVSCQTISNCTVVGYDNSNDPVVITGDPATWSPSATGFNVKADAGSPGGYFNAVSCPSATSCTAVGNDSMYLPFGLTGAASSWSSTTAGVIVAASGHGQGSLRGVSCVSDGNCVGVGYDYGSGTPMVAIETAGTWETPVDVTASSATSQGNFEGVSCSSATACTAVGYDTFDDPFIMTGNPSTWTTNTFGTIVKASASNAQGVFNAVSCTSATNCTVVGSDRSSNPIVLTGNPNGWTAATSGTVVSADPSSALGFLNAVSCTNASFCVAVGADYNGAPIVLSGNPSTWTASTTGTKVVASQFDALGQLTAVSCALASNCTVVGVDGLGEPIFLSGNPSTWTSATIGLTVKASSKAALGTLFGVSCASATACTVVGVDASNDPILLNGDPSTWTSFLAGNVVATPATATGYLNAVSCTSSTNCTVVGAEMFNGGRVAMVGANFVLPTEMITLNSRGGTSESTVSANYGALLTLPTPSLANFTFAGWYNAAVGGTRVSSPYAATTSLTLYAHWNQIPHRVRFLGNKATKGKMKSQVEHARTALSKDRFVRNGFGFAGWNTRADGKGKKFAAGARYSFLANLTLYAQWVPIPHAIKVVGYAQVGATRDLTIIGVGFTAHSRVASNEAAATVHVVHKSATAIVVSVKVSAGWTGYKPLQPKGKHFVFTVTTPARKSTSIEYTAK